MRRHHGLSYCDPIKMSLTPDFAFPFLSLCFSGSHIENWHSILRNGLVVASNTRLQVHFENALTRSHDSSVREFSKQSWCYFFTHKRVKHCAFKNHIDFLMDIHNFHKVKQNWSIYNIGMKRKLSFPMRNSKITLNLIRQKEKKNDAGKDWG